MDMYAENILFHYKNPLHYGELERASITVADSNPLCGDKLEIGLQIEDGKIVDAKFSGEGCAISQASASMLLDEVIGKSLDEVKGLEKQFVYDMLGVPLTTNRVKCALLSFVIVQQAVDTFEL